MSEPSRVPPGPGGRITNAWQLAHVLSEQLDDAAPLNMQRKWVPLAERLWARLAVPDAAGRTEDDGKADCGCAHCHSRPYSIMHICPDCGSKRCPRAAHHANPCWAE